MAELFDMENVEIDVSTVSQFIPQLEEKFNSDDEIEIDLKFHGLRVRFDKVQFGEYQEGYSSSS